MANDALKVFISSVMRRNLEDLTAEREAARDVVESFAPITCAWAFEKEPASTKPLRDSYIDEVKACDLLLLIVGCRMTPPVREEFDTARDHGKPILVFVKNVPDREPGVSEVLGLLDVKYASFSDAADLRDKARAALGQEIRRKAKPEAESLRSGDQIAQLRAFARKRAIVRVSPLVPPCQDDQFSVTEVTTDAVSLYKLSIRQYVAIPRSRIADVLVIDQHEPPKLLLEGRLQWITIPQVWQFFPEEPPSPDPYRLGFGQVSALNGPTVDALYASLRSAGWEPVWPRASRVAEIVAEGGGVYYGEDGHFLFADDLVLCVRRSQR
jgi:hypothetical protein